MFSEFFDSLGLIEDVLWNYLGIPLIILCGVLFTVQARFFQLRKFPSILKLFFGFMKSGYDLRSGVHPLKAFFASVGGCIGIGNIVVVCTAVQIGGPGALLWIWLTALVGMVLKYAEIYLGILYRVPNSRGTYSGGPTYYLKRVFHNKWLPALVSILLCIYGVEVLQFNLVTASLVHNYGLNHYLVIGGLLFLVLMAGAGGVQRVGKLCSIFIPIFTFCYVTLGLWILIQNAFLLPGVIGEVFAGAFTGHAAVGGFAGSTMLVAMSQGIRRGCYTGDVGIGYASVIHSETCIYRPERQASLAIIEIFLDTFVIVTTSVLLILVTGVWKEPIHESLLVQTALSRYYPYMEYVMPVFLFLLGYSTIIAYFCFGLNASEYLSQKWGRKIYYCCAAVALAFFSFIPSAHAMSVMSICGALLIIINLSGMFLMRKEIEYRLDKDELEPELF